MANRPFLSPAIDTLARSAFLRLNSWLHRTVIFLFDRFSDVLGRRPSNLALALLHLFLHSACCSPRTDSNSSGLLSILPDLARLASPVDLLIDAFFSLCRSSFLVATPPTSHTSTNFSPRLGTSSSRTFLSADDACSSPIPLRSNGRGSYRSHRLTATFNLFQHLDLARCHHISSQQDPASHPPHFQQAPIHITIHHVDTRVQAGSPQAARYSRAHRGR